MLHRGTKCVLSSFGCSPDPKDVPHFVQDKTLERAVLLQHIDVIDVERHCSGEADRLFMSIGECGVNEDDVERVG